MLRSDHSDHTIPNAYTVGARIQEAISIIYDEAKSWEEEAKRTPVSDDDDDCDCEGKVSFNRISEDLYSLCDRLHDVFDGII